MCITDHYTSSLSDNINDVIPSIPFGGWHKNKYETKKIQEKYVHDL